MTHNLIVRGFDDHVHTQLGETANQRGVSINSIVKDAVDKWLKEQQLQVPRKHHLIIYSDDEFMLGLLKSMDRLAKEGDLFKCFCGPPSSTSTELLSKLKWYNGTIEPYYYSGDVQDRKQQPHLQIQSQKNIMKYFGNVMENIANNSNGKQVCCMDFLINDIAKSSLKQALTIEEAYNNSRIPGLMYCTYKTKILLNSEIKDMIELFEMHDQIFIVKNDEIYKLHVTKENAHKLFLN
ncbi:MAG: plasmid partition protein ParG [Nitrososphaeraceae archaeon]